MTSRHLLRLNRGSQIRESHRLTDRDPRVQDAYSLRCTPQVHGAVRDAVAAVRTIAEIELIHPFAKAIEIIFHRIDINSKRG